MLELTGVRFSTAADEACSLMMPFFEFRNDQASVRIAHNILASDLDITELYMQFKHICNDNSLKNIPLSKLLKHLIETDSMQSHSHLIIILARMLAATPHSADVERSISANNLLKTALRTRLKLETENNYLFVHFNLPPFSEWNPEKAVLRWMSAKERRTHNLAVENDNRKAKSQPHFKGVFPHASSSQEENDNASEDSGVVFSTTSKRRHL